MLTAKQIKDCVNNYFYNVGFFWKEQEGQPTLQVFIANNKDYVNNVVANLKGKYNDNDNFEFSCEYIFAGYHKIKCVFDNNITKESLLEVITELKGLGYGFYDEYDMIQNRQFAILYTIDEEMKTSYVYAETRAKAIRHFKYVQKLLNKETRIHRIATCKNKLGGYINMPIPLEVI